ncbi:hypothetical protein Syun_004388 [Stephania yunnanensis]|uniref:Uncharacterized protein n=1 Tax=Stephania yunnanensis TaxID=152371 RepID=A0AAP0L3D2_9MAGN
MPLKASPSPSPSTAAACVFATAGRRYSLLPRKPLPMAGPSTIIACAAPAAGRRSSSRPRQPSPRAGWALFRRYLCSPRRWSPLFVAARKPSPLARPSIVAACAAPAASRLVHRCVGNHRRWLGPLSLQPPPLVADVRHCVGNHRRLHSPSAAAGYPCPADVRRSSSLFVAARRHIGYTGYTGPSVDDEAVCFNVVGKCPKGRVYSLGSLGRKKKRYPDPSASTSQMPEIVPHSEFDSVAEQLQQVVVFMQRQFGMSMDGAGLSQLQPPPPHEHQQPPQVDLVDPPQQQDNVEREMQDWLTRDEQLGDTYVFSLLFV